MATGSSKVASHNKELGEDDLAELQKVLFPARNRCIDFGLQIGLGGTEIESIEQMHKEPRDRLRAILTARLKKSEPLSGMILMLHSGKSVLVSAAQLIIYESDTLTYYHLLLALPQNMSVRNR